MSTRGFKNALLTGPSGYLGSALLKSLLAQPKLSVTALARNSSTALESLRTTPNLRVITIDDSYPKEALVEAFRGQDVVLSGVGSLDIPEQYRMVDAAAEAGVKRFVPSEYGLNNANKKAQALTDVFGDKAKITDYIQTQEKQGLTWHSFAVGMWIAW
jgi:uncharacterized protein YbjT (DUF2867 family)